MLNFCQRLFVNSAKTKWITRINPPMSRVCVLIECCWAKGAVAEQAESARDGSPWTQRSGKHQLCFISLFSPCTSSSSRKFTRSALYSQASLCWSAAPAWLLLEVLQKGLCERNRTKQPHTHTPPHTRRIITITTAVLSVPARTRAPGLCKCRERFLYLIADFFFFF